MSRFLDSCFPERNFGRDLWVIIIGMLIAEEREERFHPQGQETQ